MFGDKVLIAYTKNQDVKTHIVADIDEDELIKDVKDRMMGVVY